VIRGGDSSDGRCNRRAPRRAPPSPRGPAPLGPRHGSELLAVGARPGRCSDGHDRATPTSVTGPSANPPARSRERPRSGGRPRRRAQELAHARSAASPRDAPPGPAPRLPDRLGAHRRVQDLGPSSAIVHLRPHSGHRQDAGHSHAVHEHSSPQQHPSADGAFDSQSQLSGQLSQAHRSSVIKALLLPFESADESGRRFLTAERRNGSGRDA